MVAEESVGTSPNTVTTPNDLVLFSCLSNTLGGLPTWLVGCNKGTGAANGAGTFANVLACLDACVFDVDVVVVFKSSLSSRGSDFDAEAVIG